MGLYISNVKYYSQRKESLDSYIKSVSKRKTNNVFFFYENNIYLYSNNLVKRLDECKGMENHYPVAICKYALENKIDTFEFLLTENQENNPLCLEDSLNYLYPFAIENDFSIGLLARSELFIYDNEDLLNSFGVMFADVRTSFALECITFRPERPKIVKNKKPISRPRRSSALSMPISDMKLDESFHEKFLRFYYASMMDAPEVYNRGGISRQVFSKVLSVPDFIPKKETIICLIIGLKLKISEARELLDSAGFTLSGSIGMDSIVARNIRKGTYDIDAINAELNEQQYPLLGWRPREN